MHFKDQPKNRSYLLRVWEERGATPPWRFTLIHLKSEARRGFGSFAALVAFLEEEVNQLASVDTTENTER